MNNNQTTALFVTFSDWNAVLFIWWQSILMLMLCDMKWFVMMSEVRLLDILKLCQSYVRINTKKMIRMFWMKWRIMCSMRVTLTDILLLLLLLLSGLIITFPRDNSDSIHIVLIISKFMIEQNETKTVHALRGKKPYKIII